MQPVQRVEWAYRAEGLNLTQKAILAYLAFTCNRTTYKNHRSVVTIGKAISCDEKTVRRNLPTLEAKGFLTCEPRHNDTHKITLHIVHSQPDSEAHSWALESDPDEVDSVSQSDNGASQSDNGASQSDNEAQTRALKSYGQSTTVIEQSNNIYNPPMGDSSKQGKTTWTPAEIHTAGTTHGITEEQADEFVTYWTEQQWLDKYGVQINAKSLPSKISNYMSIARSRVAQHNRSKQPEITLDEDVYF